MSTRAGVSVHAHNPAGRLRELEAQLRAVEGTSIDATPIIQEMIDLGKRTIRIGKTLRGKGNICD